MVTGSQDFHNDNKGHRLYTVITLIVVWTQKRDSVEMEVTRLHVNNFAGELRKVYGPGLYGNPDGRYNVLINSF